MKPEYSAEQVEAIESLQGTLVSAGAGSGKTAVLVEHIIFWMSRLDAFQANAEKKIITELKRLVVVTFTIKASLEMKLRLADRLDELCQGEENQKKWLEIKNNIDHVFIGTIDGYCSHLLRQNGSSLAVTGVPVAIVSGQEWKKKIKQLFQQWIHHENEEIGKLWSARWTRWLYGVFGSTEERLRWVHWANNQEKLALNTEDYLQQQRQAFLEIAAQENWENLKTQARYILSQFSDDDIGDKKWWNYLQGFCQLLNSHQDEFDFLNVAINWNQEWRTVSTPNQEKYLEIKEWINDIRAFFKSTLEINQDWVRCSSVEGIEEWKNFTSVALRIVKFIEENYGWLNGFCFSDLSYYVYLGLQAKTLRQDLDLYIVIDELQDTSIFQLTLLYELVKKNPDALYGVGDVKQAIYGFRGGQAHVFFEFQRLVGRRIDLFDNYRSAEEIVTFNNEIFSKLFDKTRSKPQLAKTEIDGVSGVAAVELLRWDLEEGLKIESWQEEYLECLALIRKIKIIRENDVKGSIAVLFRTNNQIQKFSSVLAQEKLSFDVQWQLEIADDPHYWTFHYLLTLMFSKLTEKKIEPIEKAFHFHLKTMGVADTAMEWDSFFREWELFDAYTCFVRWLSRVGFTVPLQAPFLKILKDNSTLEETSIEDTLQWLEEVKSDTSLTVLGLPLGSVNQDAITLQTIHASKGLQFDHVLLARVNHTRPYSRQSDLFSDSPCSLQQASYLKNSWKTPCWYRHYQEEKLLSREESIRLFYVACTRARKSLSMVILQKKLSASETWAKLLSNIPDQLVKKTNFLVDDEVQRFLQQESRLIPIYQAKIMQQWRGKLLSSSIDLPKLLPSLSVTALSTYQKCSLKFYFSNILQIDVSGLETTYAQSPVAPVSSISRGIKLHQIFADFFTKKISVQQMLGSMDESASQAVRQRADTWATLLNNFEKVRVEEEVRFVWQDCVIMGTPDIFFVANGVAEIWDFKTGHLDQEDLETYYLQLYWYAYALWQKGEFMEELIVKIIAIDDNLDHQKKVSISEVISFLDDWWRKFSDYSTKNLAHCSKCSYQLICSR